MASLSFSEPFSLFVLSFSLFFLSFLKVKNMEKAKLLSPGGMAMNEEHLDARLQRLDGHKMLKIHQKPRFFFFSVFFFFPFFSLTSLLIAVGVVNCAESVVVVIVVVNLKMNSKLWTNTNTPCTTLENTLPFVV